MKQHPCPKTIGGDRFGILGSKPDPVGPVAQKLLARSLADPENLVAICLWGEKLFHFVAGSCGTVVEHTSLEQNC